MMMRINLDKAHQAFIRLLENPHQVITLDANIIIPPDRRPLADRGLKFKQFKDLWLDPLFGHFSNLALHEAVYEELVGTDLQAYIDAKRRLIPPQIKIHVDASLNGIERVLRDAIESKIALHTKYEPLLDNKDDRGEVKSLAFIAVKGLLYFAANDYQAMQLIEKASEWSTGLDNVQAIRMYELIYVLYRKNLADKKALRMLYKYLYHFTEREKNTNPSWSDFSYSMDRLYDAYFKTLP